MNRDEAQARVREVQRIMERTTLYTLLPGTPALVGGALALIGCAVTFLFTRSLDFQDVLFQTMPVQIGLAVMWVVIAVAAISQEIVWTRRAARKQEISPMARPALFAVISLSPGVIVAMVLTLKFVWELRLEYIVPVWAMCYGTALYAAGLFSVRLPRLLGLAFIVIGALGLLVFEKYGLATAAVSFGLLHIVFGAMVLSRTQRESET